MEERVFEGFVLTGGRSSRMGRDKALLPVDGSTASGRTLVEQIAARVRAAAGSVTLIGSPERYAGLGLPVAADLIGDCGPIGGVYTALKISSAPWNLIVACDMPAVTTGLLAALLDAARDADAECLVPETGSGRHPLCAVYHRRALVALQYAIDHKSFKMHDLLRSFRTIAWPAVDSSLLENVNTPVEWGAR
jgi:molybdopterin-guanine dinucleotide biosynthesis protein A